MVDARSYLSVVLTSLEIPHAAYPPWKLPVERPRNSHHVHARTPRGPGLLPPTLKHTTWIFLPIATGTHPVSFSLICKAVWLCRQIAVCPRHRPTGPRCDMGFVGRLEEKKRARVCRVAVYRRHLSGCRLQDDSIFGSLERHVPAMQRAFPRSRYTRHRNATGPEPYETWRCARRAPAGLVAERQQSCSCCSRSTSRSWPFLRPGKPPATPAADQARLAMSQNRMKWGIWSLG